MQVAPAGAGDHVGRRRCRDAREPGLHGDADRARPGSGTSRSAGRANGQTSEIAELPASAT